MARTVRRTRDKKRNKSGRSHFERDYTHRKPRSERPNGFYAWGSYATIKLEGKEFDQAYWLFHRDHDGGYGWGNHKFDRWHYENRCRMKNKEEIIRYYKDEDYEVFAHQPGNLAWER